MKKENNVYTLTCKTAPEFARETYYKSAHTYNVEIPADNMPHELKVWLVDNMGKVGVHTADSCNVADAIAHIAALKNEADVLINACIKAVEETPARELIYFNPNNAFNYQYSLVQQIKVDGDIIQIPWDKLSHVEKMVLAEIETIKKEKEIETAYQKETHEQKKQDRLTKVRAIIEKTCPEDLPRFDAGFMSITDQSEYLKNELFPVPENFKLWERIDVDAMCDCEENEINYVSNRAEELTKDEFANLQFLEKAFPEAHVYPTVRLAECDECGEEIVRIEYDCSMTVGDLSIERRFLNKND